MKSTQTPRHHLRNPLLALLFLAAAAAAQITMAAEPEQAAAAQEAAVHIVYVDRPEDADPEEFHIRTLSPVLGSEEKARDAVLYHYKHAASGFSAKLTAEQVEDLKTNLLLFSDKFVMEPSGSGAAEPGEDGRDQEPAHERSYAPPMEPDPRWRRRGRRPTRLDWSAFLSVSWFPLAQFNSLRAGEAMHRKERKTYKICSPAYGVAAIVTSIQDARDSISSKMIFGLNVEGITAVALLLASLLLASLASRRLTLRPMAVRRYAGSPRLVLGSYDEHPHDAWVLLTVVRHSLCCRNGRGEQRLADRSTFTLPVSASSITAEMPVFSTSRLHSQTRFSTLPNGIVIAPATPSIPPIINLNVTHVDGQSSDMMPSKQARSIPMATTFDARKLFDGMQTQTIPPEDPNYTQFMQGVIYEGNGQAFHVDDQDNNSNEGHAFDPEETQSQDGRGQYGVDEE
ncbi:Subtilisin-like protease [Hordeum vulgare]|nr:Subtilisin-like protease [Hordeum vulgare]